MAQRKALGRGLNALMGAPETEAEQLREIDIDRILPNGQQPRRNFDEESLNELADSIRVHGVIQPIIVQPLPDNFFQIIAGERRWRASQRAGLVRIPVVVRDIGVESSLEIALIENLQREDLNPIEEAQAYEKLIVELGLTQDEVARRVGKSRATITNMLRLLRLPADVQQWISETKLSTGHAKALLALSELGSILEAARKIIQGGLSVRQAEALVSRYAKGHEVGKELEGDTATQDPNVAAAIHALEQNLGTKVTILDHGGKGRIELHFFSFEEMNRLYEGLVRARF
jgi:ParB family transcriptional regulator, chromosome partitioning protein